MADYNLADNGPDLTDNADGSYNLSGYRQPDHVHAAHAKVWTSAIDPKNAERGRGAQPGDIWLDGGKVSILNAQKVWVAV